MGSLVLNGKLMITAGGGGGGDRPLFPPLGSAPDTYLQLLKLIAQESHSFLDNNFCHF